ncbi:hypothetical protein Golob_020817, partial [Gossypium lobatum]|nr:hypothetical protein [Gossypium lobatum]
KLHYYTFAIAMVSILDLGCKQVMFLAF